MFVSVNTCRQTASKKVRVDLASLFYVMALSSLHRGS